MTNLSDGRNNGFVLYYVRDEELNAVVLTENQKVLLDVSLKAIFGEESAKVVPIGANIKIMNVKELKERI